MTPVTSAAEWDARQKELQEQRTHWISETVKAQCARLSVEDELAALGERPEDLDVMRAELTELRAWVAARKSARRPVKQDCAVLKGFIKGLEAKVVEAESELTELRAFKAACEGAKPVAWMNKYHDGSQQYRDRKDQAEAAAAPHVHRTAVPLYEHPAPVVAVTDDDLRAALGRAFAEFFPCANPLQGLHDSYVAAIRALLTRTQEAR